MTDPAPPELELIVGGYYAVYSAKTETFRVHKLLAFDDRGVHVRMYEPTFPELPDETVIPLLKSRIGHAPVGRGNFLRWKPELIAVREVADDELDGYRLWEEAKGGYFGT